MSVVIPVYNAGTLLRPCIDSVLGQDLLPGAFEVIAVDDGSTDGSGGVLDDYAATHPNIQVIHQPNAGWPGRPRNVGTDIARGDYVFYLDADDMLGPQALRRMVEFADQHRSDVVLGSTQWLKDEHPFRDPHMETRVDAPLDRVFRSLAPHKLLRRSFIQAAELRFPEGRVPLEDGIVMARAYLLASRVSTLGGSKSSYYYRRPTSRAATSAAAGPIPTPTRARSRRSWTPSARSIMTRIEPIGSSLGCIAAKLSSSSAQDASTGTGRATNTGA